MGLEDALKAVKTVYPLYKPWHYKKRKKALGKVRALVEGVEGIDNQETQDYVGRVLKHASVYRWNNKEPEKSLERSIEVLQSWYQWDPQALAIFATESIYEQRNDGYVELHLEQLKAVAETYKEKFGQESARGFLEGFIKGKKTQSSVENTLTILEREDVQHVLSVANKYGPNVIYAMSKSLSCNIGETCDIRTSRCKKAALLLEGEDAQKVYEAYKDAGRFVVSGIIERMVQSALSFSGNFHSECGNWNNEYVSTIVKDARNYGPEIEKGIFATIMNIADNPNKSVEKFSFFQTEAFHRLTGHYQSAPKPFAKIVECIGYANSYGKGKDSKKREKLMNAFLRKDVEELLLKYKDATSIENVIYGIDVIVSYASVPETIQNAIDVLRAYQERSPDNVEKIYSQFLDIIKSFWIENKPEAERNLNRFMTALARDDVQNLVEWYTREWSMYKENYSNPVVSMIAEVAVQEEAAIPVFTDFLSKIRAKEPNEVLTSAKTVQEYAKKQSELIPAICAYLQTEQGREKKTRLSTAISVLSKGSELYERVKTGEITLKDIGDVAQSIETQQFVPTQYLVAEVYQAQDKQATIKDWKQVLNTFADGNFDATNELHRNIEYTRFRRFVDHEKVKKYIKNHFTYDSYESIFSNPAATSQAMSEKDQFEIECAAYEAGKLYDFIKRVKTQADKIRRKVVVVPNFSYGYLPVSPLVSDLRAEGIETILGIKVGSTECHESKDVMNSRLFKGHRTELVNEQPVIIVVDGTQHLIAREGDGKGARYPDAHQSYLNQVIAMNDALGQAEGREYVGKSANDCARLRATEEYQRTVKVYKQGADETPKQPYQFALWNTAEMEMIVRGERQEAAKVMPMTPEAIAGPTLIFCNVGVPQEQIPEEMREEYQGQEHQPAYFDDSDRIIEFDFRHDNYGVRYLNRLETEVKNAFEKQRGCKETTGHSAEGIPEIVRYISKVKTRAPVEECSV